MNGEKALCVFLYSHTSACENFSVSFLVKSKNHLIMFFIIKCPGPG